MGQLYYNQHPQIFVKQLISLSNKYSAEAVGLCVFTKREISSFQDEKRRAEVKQNLSALESKLDHIYSVSIFDGAVYEDGVDACASCKRSEPLHFSKDMN